MTSGGPSETRFGLTTVVRLLCGVSGGTASVIEFVVGVIRGELIAEVVVTAAC